MIENAQKAHRDMKKRKPPVMLASILVVLVAVVAIMNRQPSAGGDGHNHGEQPQEDQSQVLAKSRETESKESLAAMTKAKVKPKEKQVPGEEEAAPVVGDAAKFKYDPKPGESPIATQWYTEESGVKEKK